MEWATTPLKDAQEMAGGSAGADEYIEMMETKTEIHRVCYQGLQDMMPEGGKAASFDGSTVQVVRL